MLNFAWRHHNSYNTSLASRFIIFCTLYIFCMKVVSRCRWTFSTFLNLEHYYYIVLLYFLLVFIYTYTKLYIYFFPGVFFHTHLLMMRCKRVVDSYHGTLLQKSTLVALVSIWKTGKTRVWWCFYDTMIWQTHAHAEEIDAFTNQKNCRKVYSKSFT